jgi:receptor protein-tyrosine kinase
MTVTADAGYERAWATDGANMNEQNQPTFDLRHYLQVLRRRRFVVLAVLIAIPAIVLVLSLNQPRSYQAISRVMVESQSATINAITGQNLGTQQVDDREVATLSSFVVTPSVTKAVLNQLGWNEAPLHVMEQVVATPDLNANVINIAANQPTSARSAELANAYATQFVAWRQTMQQAALQSAIELTVKQLANLAPGSSDYQSQLARKNQLEILKTLTGGGVSIGELADNPTAPASPKPIRNTALALGAALVLGVGLAFLREALDVKIHTIDDLEQLAAVPVITTIDQLPKEYRRNGKLVTLEDPRSPVAEGYRMLRTNLEFINFNRDLGVILVTSPLPSQGKSTTIANLAVVLLKSGKKVAVVEGDLRRPTLHSYFKVPNDVGLTSVIAGTVPLDQAVRVLTLRESAPVLRTPDLLTEPKRSTRVDASGAPIAVAVKREQAAAASAVGSLELRLLTSGPLPPNPGEIATSKQLSDLLDALKADNDYVLVDAPPMLAVGDAAAIAGKVDGVIVIVRLDETTRDMVSQVNTFLERVPSRALGIVVAGASRSKRESYYYSGYYY